MQALWHHCRADEGRHCGGLQVFAVWWFLSGLCAVGEANMSLVLDDGMSEEEFMAWLASLDTSEDVGEQG